MQKLIQGLHKFQEEVFNNQEGLFKELEKGQHPQVLFITCSDSRIDPNLITQTEPGDLFIIRNAGNIVPPYGAQASGETASIEFAIDGLGIRDIVICGHSHCGAMKAILQPKAVENMPAMKAWLTNAEITKRVVFEHYQHLEGDAKLMATIQENVLMQMENLKTHPSVASKLAQGKIRLHAWVYKFETGMVFAFDPVTGQFKPLNANGTYQQPIMKTFRSEGVTA